MAQFANPYLIWFSSYCQNRAKKAGFRLPVFPVYTNNSVTVRAIEKILTPFDSEKHFTLEKL